MVYEYRLSIYFVIDTFIRQVEQTVVSTPGMIVCTLSGSTYDAGNLDTSKIPVRPDQPS